MPKMSAVLISDTALLLQTDDKEVKQEAIWCIGNATCSRDPAHIDHLLLSKCLPPLVESVGESAAKTQKVHI
jgi:hypothetical protein